jgi:hypothetical protein
LYQFVPRPWPLVNRRAVPQGMPLIRKFEVPEPDQLDQLIARPAESLNVELKTWISPVEPEGIAKIIKATFAIFNRNGGYLLIGFNNDTSQPDLNPAAATVPADFHIDAVQELISRYASKPFEVAVEFRTRDGQEHPIVVVPPGVKTVVAVKRDIVGGTGNARLLQRGDVYFRTLGANGIVSSARAQPDDWEDILSICFDNREADIARFIRRHLAGDLEGLRTVLEGGPRRRRRSSPQRSDDRMPVSELIVPKRSAERQAAEEPIRERRRTRRVDLAEETMRVLIDGKASFEGAIAERKDVPHGSPELQHGRWNVSLVITPLSEGAAQATPTREFLRELEVANPNLTGWPVWLISSSFSDERSRPYVRNGAWEELIISLGGWSAHFEFQRLSPKGEFFLSRVLQDDLVEAAGAPGTALDPILAILRVAEAVTVGLAFAKALGASLDGTKLGFIFEWTNLSGRTLKAWANPMTIMPPWFSSARDANVTTYVEVPLDTAPSAIAPYVQRAVAALFAAFDGATISTAVIEEWVRRLVERKLGS